MKNHDNKTSSFNPFSQSAPSTFPHEKKKLLASSPVEELINTYQQQNANLVTRLAKIRESDLEIGDELHGMNVIKSDDYEDGFISYSVDGEGVNGLINGIVFDIDKDEEILRKDIVTVVMTQNCGMRYAGVDDEGRITDLGHVSHPVLIGNHNNPEGLYIPLFSNAKPIEDGLIILSEMMDMHKLKNE